ncbi:helix-turn-helix domain-containing protein [Chondrinema litorale]|uniref:helix-turn-helix domain-containing protein n=1 Tax=Chondrinema litorale TaxID=2994555 RepID=UPI0025429F56|nr:helix-turn-helix domain-containing protein [Chondrinema litorale]UZS00055.1 helix-turn-helix domain-containing protein [Chondrinema litorale]
METSGTSLIEIEIGTSNIDLGSKVKATRGGKMLSLCALAKKSGVSKSRVSDLEKGKNVNSETLLKVLEGLGAKKILIQF